VLPKTSPISLSWKGPTPVVNPSKASSTRPTRLRRPSRPSASRLRKRPPSCFVYKPISPALEDLWLLQRFRLREFWPVNCVVFLCNPGQRFVTYARSFLFLTCCSNFFAVYIFIQINSITFWHESIVKVTCSLILSFWVFLNLLNL
jgi:hypothetical protein